MMYILWVIVMVAAILVEAASFALLSIWFAAGAPRQQDGLRGRRLGNQLPDAAPLVLGVLQLPLWLGTGGL